VDGPLRPKRNLMPRLRSRYCLTVNELNPTPFQPLHDGNELTDDNLLASSRAVNSANSAVETAAADADMSDDAIAGPSLLLAVHEKAHREHLLQSQHHHHRLHKKQTTDGVVTEVVTTVSVVQQINVDTNGNTLTVQTLLADSTGSQVVLTDASSPTTTTDSASPSMTSPASSTSPTAASEPDYSVSQTFLSSPGPSAVTSSLSIPASFASHIVSSNSTTCK
jgi:hypothetical protein